MLTTLDFEGVAAVTDLGFCVLLALVRMAHLHCNACLCALNRAAKIGLTASVAILALSIANPTVALMNLNAADFLICGVQELVVGSVMGIGLGIMLVHWRLRVNWLVFKWAMPSRTWSIRFVSAGRCIAVAQSLGTCTFCRLRWSFTGSSGLV